MVRINRIYTRTGDDGSTGLVGGDRIEKDAPRVEAYGEVDELNALCGLLRTEAEGQGASRFVEMIAIVQNELFDIGAELATPPGREWPQMAKANSTQAARLEGWIDELTEGIPELKSFVLPGGTLLNSYCHIARTVCRRAERRVIALSRSEPINPEIVRYINRLSDFLFALARAESSRSGTPEYLWKPGKIG